MKNLFRTEVVIQEGRLDYAGPRLEIVEAKGVPSKRCAIRVRFGHESNSIQCVDKEDAAVLEQFFRQLKEAL